MFSNIQFDQVRSVSTVVLDDGLFYGIVWETGETVFCYESSFCKTTSF